VTPRAAAMSALALALAASSLVAPVRAEPPRGGSVGAAHDGRLEGAVALPLDGHGYRFYGPVATRGTRFATLELGALIARAARVLHEHAPGPPLVVGDCSAEDGGRIPRHVSHQSGRDVDLLFLARDATGEPVELGRFVRFDGAGRCVSPGCDVVFDVARNWWLVRTLVASREPAVQYIFVSEPLRALLIAHAEAHGEHPELLRRARRILHQPTSGAPHDDHFHVRIHCLRSHSPRCRDVGPRWPWVDARGRAAPIR